MFDFEDDPLNAAGELEDAGYTSPFDEAAATAAPEDATEPPPQLEFGEVPPAKKKRSHSKKGAKPSGARRGRPPGGGGKAARSHSAPVKGPPAPTAPATPPQTAPEPTGALQPAQLAPLLKKLDSMLAERLGTEPLTDAESSEGAQVLAPIIHHYMPMITESEAPWMPGAVWVLLVYGPRFMDRAQPARASAPAQESATPSAATFRTPNDSPSPAAAAPTITPAATAPVFVNPLDDQPYVPPQGLPG